MKKIAVLPGSFDPITIGHSEIVERALPLFDKIIVAIGVNSSKKYVFSLEQRMQWLEMVFEDKPTVEVQHFTGLTAHFCQKVDASYMIRGLRTASDFDYERIISQLNYTIGDGLETVFFISEPKYSHISSTIVREIIRGGGDVSPFIPSAIQEDLKAKAKAVMKL
jgi:pantetheine-phosphate adenylyltransferase